MDAKVSLANDASTSWLQYMYLDKVVKCLSSLNQSLKVTHRLCSSNMSGYQSNTANQEYNSVSIIANENLFL